MSAVPPLFHLGSTQSQPPALLIIARVLLIVDQLQPGACIALSCILCGQPESAAIIAPVHPGLAHPGVVAPWCPLCALLPPVSVSLLLRHAVAAWCLHYAVMPFVGQHALCNIAPALLSLGEVCSACRQPALCIFFCTPCSLVSRPCYQTCTHIRQAACIVQCPLRSLVSSFLAAGRAVTACRLALHISAQILLSVVQLQPGNPGAACIVHCSRHSSLLGKYVLCCRTCSRNLPPPLHIVAQVLLSVEQSQLGACFVRSCPSWGSLHCALSPAIIAHAGRAVAACRLHCILSLKSCSPWSSRSLVPALRGHAHRILHCSLHSSLLGKYVSLLPDVQSQPAAWPQPVLAVPYICYSLAHHWHWHWHTTTTTTTISRVQSAKFLGVIIHQNLSWKPHIEMICSKTSKVIGLICKARQYLHSNTLKTLYNSLFLPYVNYCNLIWASTYNTHINPLLLLQKKAIRIITFSPPRTHTKPIFQKLNILPIFSLYKFQISAFVFSHINKLLPSALSSLFQFNFECHSHQTRSRFNLHKQFFSSVTSTRSLEQSSLTTTRIT